MRFKLIICDNDGVLLDSTYEAMEQYQKTAFILRIPIPSISLMKIYWGETGEQLTRRMGENLGWSHLDIEKFEVLYKQRIITRKYKAVSGMITTLNAAFNRGVKLAIITSRDKSSLTENLVKVGYDMKIFSYIQTPCDHTIVKPNPEVFRNILDRSLGDGIQHDEIVYIGDTLRYDMKAAHSFVPKINFIGMTTGIVNRTEFKFAGLDDSFIVNDGHELLPILMDD